MLMCIQNLVKFRPLVLKILSGNENYDGMTEILKDRITELQKDRQGKSSIAPTFSKQGYNYGTRNNRMTEGQAKSNIAPLFQSWAIISIM